MSIIIGIDPGSIRTGFGIIHAEKNNLIHVAHGTIQSKGDSVAERLYFIYENLCAVIAEHKPTAAAIEEVFMHINIQSALKLGQARGAAMMAVACHGIPLHEYGVRVIKKTAVGFGAASKEQMQFMMRTQLGLSANPQADAADALAIAVCHAQHQAFSDKIQLVD